MTRWPNFVRQLIRHPAALVVAVFALSCLGDSSGPDVARPGYFQLVPSFQSAAPSGLVTLDRVRVLLYRYGTTTVALDTTARIAPTDTALDLNLTVAVFTAADTFTARLSLITPSGDTAFSGGPLTVIGRPSIRATTPTGPPVSVPLTYVGTGAGADSVVITVIPPSVITGDTVQFQAVAYDNNAPVPGTPIGWTTLDPLRASIPVVGSGRVRGGNERGVARIVAQTLTGQADTASITVHLAAASISVVSGNNQSAVVRTLLASPVIAQIQASDGLPVPGAWIKFAVQSGGGSVTPDSALTDATGKASAQWTLGPSGGLQQLRAAPRLGAAVLTLFAATGLAGTSGSITVSAGDGQSATVGTAVTTAPTVLVKDPDGNPVPNATVTFAVATGGGSVTGAIQNTDASGIARAGSWTLGTIAGSNSLTASVSDIFGTATADSAKTRAVADSTSRTSAPTSTVTQPAPTAIFTTTFTALAIPGAATALQVTGLPASINAGFSTNVIVTLRDTYGNVAKGYRGTIRFTSTDGSATLPANHTFVAADNGLHAFPVMLATAGSQSITVTDIGQGSLTATAGTLVNPVAAPSFTVTGLASSYVAGSKGTLVVTAKDGSGNTIPNYTGTVRFDSNDPLASLPLDYTFTPGDNGTHTFTSAITLRVAGNRSVTVTDVDVSVMNGTQNVTVVATAPAYFLVTGLPDSSSLGFPYDLTVTAKDTFSNTATGYTGTIHFETPADDDASRPSDYRFTGPDAGIHVFSPGVTFTTPCLQALVVTDVNDQGLAGIATTEVRGCPLATHLGFVSQPSNTAAGTPFTPPVVVVALNDNEQPVSGFTGQITIAIASNPAGGTLHGTTTVQAAGGVASFADLYIDTPGIGYTLEASGGGLTPAVSARFDIGAALPVIHWINSSGGNWSLGTNWDANRPPLATEVVDLTAAGSYSVNLDVPATVAGLNLGDASGAQSLLAGATTLTVNGPITIGSGGAAILAGTSVLGSSTLYNQGLLLVHGTVGISPAITNAPGATIRVEGLAANSTGTLTTLTDLTNAGTIELTDVGAAYGAFLGVTGTLTNAPGGSIVSQIGGNGSRQLAAQLNNLGTVTLNRALTLNRTAVAHVNGGTIDVIGGTFTLTQSGTGATFTNNGVINLGAAWAVSGGVLDVSAGTITGGGLLSVNGSTFHYSVASLPAVLSLNNVTIPSGLNIGTGEMLTLQTSNFTAPVSIDGTLIIHGNTTLGGTLTTGASSMLRVEGLSSASTGTLSVTNGFTNTGTIELTDVAAAYGANLTVTNGTLTNAPGGNINVLVGGNGGRTLSAELANEGTVTINRSLTMNASDVDHTNSGTIDIAAGTLTLNQSGSSPSFTNTGTVALTGNWTVTSGTLDLSNGTVGGTGLLTVSGSNFFYTLTSIPATISLVNATLPAGLTIGTGETLTLLNSNFASPVSNAGTLIVHGNTTLGGPFTTTALSTLRIEGLASASTGNLTFSNGFTNTGTIELTDVAAAYGASLTVTTGTLTNSPTGNINVLTGGNGGRVLTAQLDNQGTVTLNRALTMNGVSAAHTNSGTINIAAGGLTLSQSGTSPSFTNSSTGTVTLTGNWTVVGGTLDLTNGSIPGAGLLTVNTATLLYSLASMPSTVTLTSVTIPAGLNIPNGQTFTLLNSDLTSPVTNNGTLIVHGNTTLGALTTGNPSTLRIEGLASASTGNLSVTGPFTNNSIIELTDVAAAYGASLTVTGGSLTNATTGNINVLTGGNGSRVLTAQLDNQGTVTLNRALTINGASAVHTNNGTINVAGGALTLTQSGTSPAFTNTGLVNLTNNWTVNGGTLDLSGGTMTGSGLLSVNTATLLYSLGSMPGTVSLNGVTIPAGLNIGNSQTLTLLNSNFASVVTNDGTLVIHGNTTLGGSLATSISSILRVEGLASASTGNLTVTNPFANTGTIELTDVAAAYGASLTVSNGSLTNGSTGNINIQLGGNGSRVLTAQLDNQGTVTLNRALTINGASAAHTNTGTINIAGGALTLAQSGITPSFTNTGLMDLTNNWTVTGGTLDLSAGNIPGSGLLTVNTATFIYGFSSIPGTLALNGVTIPAGLTIPGGTNLTLLNSNFAAAVNNSGTLVIHGNTTLGGSLTTNTGSTLRVEGLASASTGNLTVTNPFTNNANIILTDVGAAYGASLTLSNGTLINGLQGIITADVGGNGSRVLAAQLDNRGQVILNRAMTMNASNATHLNSGTIDLTGGALTLTQSAGGSFTNQPGSFIDLNNNWNVTGGSLDLSAGGFTGTAVLGVTNATLSYNAGSLPATMSLNSTTIPAGLTIPTGQTLTLLSSSFGSPVNNNGTLVIHGNTTLGGLLTTGTASTLRVEGVASASTGALTVTNGFTNNGTLVLTDVSAAYGASLAVPTGNLTNASTGLVDVQVGGNGNRTLSAQLSNQGQMTVNRPLTINANDADHSNSGTLAVNANLTISQGGSSPSFTNTGTITIAGGTTLSLNGGGGNFTNANSPAAGVIQGTGTLNLSGGNVLVNAGIINPGTAGTVGTLSITGDVTFQPTSLVNIDWVSGSTYDVLAVNGDAAAAGEVHLNFLNPALLTSLTPVTYGSHTGTFNVTGGGLIGALNLSPVFNLLNLVVNIIV